MNVGVVGNPTIGDLKSLLAHSRQTAPPLGITLFSESTSFPAPAPAPLAEGPALDADHPGGDGTRREWGPRLTGPARPQHLLGVTLGRVGFLTTANA